MSEFWNKCLDILRQQHAQAVFQTWFADLKADDTGLEDGVLTLIADSSQKSRMTQESYGKAITGIVNQVAGRNIDITWTVEQTPETTLPDPVTPPAPAVNTSEQSGLLPNLTFENLVLGSANQLAFAAASQVATNPGTQYNPLFIYGGVGLGKTHLMHAIGHRFLETHPNARVRCVSAQQYLSEYTTAMRKLNAHDEQALQRFEMRYQDLDLLLIDDIQSFANRDGTQTNFFLAFERMVPRGKQIVLTSDTYPRNLKDFQERLLSRLTQGLVVSVDPPELDMRIQILMQKAARSGLDMPEDVAVTIAKRLKSNVRELEGAVQQVLAYTNFHDVDVTIDTVKVALRDIFKVSAVPVTIDNIQQAVAEYYNLKLSDMTSKSRKGPIVYARQVAMYLAKELTQKSLPEIAEFFGKRDHTTVMYACRKIQAARNTDEGLKHEINILEQRLKN